MEPSRISGKPQKRNARLLRYPGLLLWLIACALLFGGSVNLTLVNGTRVLSTFAIGGGDGATLAEGSIVRIGTFDTSGANLSILANSTSFSEVDALFTPLGESIPDAGTVNPPNASGFLTVNNPGGVNPGGVLGSVEDYSNAYIPEGTQLFIWVFNTDDLGNVIPGEWGIFTSTSPAWLLPADGALDATLLSGSAVDTAIVGTITPTQLQLALGAVPEPSSTVLLALAGFSAILSVRSRRRGF